ncbi:hypothetical protein VPH35_126304 [Triticum aestivum]
MALRYGLSIAQRAGCNRLVINSDNMEVIETMNNGGRSSSIAAAVLDDCYFLACDFPITKFEHCNREANRVAHELANLARFSSPLNWFEEPLSEIVSLLINDVLVIVNE